jgi:amino acid transporter
VKYNQKINIVLIKLLTFILIFAIIANAAFSVNYLEGFVVVVIFFLICLLSGIYIRLKISKEKHMLKAIGWGLLYGSLASAIIIGSILAWFSIFYFDKH